MKRCSPCNKSRHYNCQKGSCECKCRTHADDIAGRDEKNRLSDPANDEFIDKINEEFRALQNPVEKET